MFDKKENKKKKMKITMFIVMFLIIGALFIISNNNLALKKSENFDLFLSSYGNWLSNVFNNAVKTTGFIVKMDWLPKSSK